jgi:hypothetical protein
MHLSSTSAAINDSSKEDLATTTYRVTRNMVYPIATNVRYHHHSSSRNQPKASSSTQDGDRSSSQSSTRSPSLCSLAASSSDSSYSPSSSSRSPPISPLTYCTSATAPLSQSKHLSAPVSSLSSYQAPFDPSNPAILPLYRPTTYTSRRNVPDFPVNSPRPQANSVSTTPSYGFPNGTQFGFAAPQPHQIQITSPTACRTDQEQLLANHDLPRSLPPLPNLQTSNNLSALQHTYISMLAKDPLHGSNMKHTPTIANSSVAATAPNHDAAPRRTVSDGLFEPGVSRSHADSCDDNEMEPVLTVDAAFPSSTSSCSHELNHPCSSAASSQAISTSDERSVATEPLTFDSVFNSASQSNGTAPPTPFIHDASAFTSMQNSLPSTTIFADLATNFAYETAAGQAAFVSTVQSTPPSASEPPALSFSPTSPFEAMLSATPGTGLSLMDVDSLDADFDTMPLFGFEDGYTLPLFSKEEDGHSSVSPSVLGLKGVAQPLPSAPLPVATALPAQPTNELDGLISMSDTPSVVHIPLSTTFLPAPLSPTSAYLNDMSSTDALAPAAAQKPATRPTGHRKNLSPSALLPVDAPTQHRSYRGPSATSRKDIPAFAFTSSSRRAVTSKKRKAEADPEDADGDDDNDEEEMATGKIKPRMGESEIEAKRRQNTLAARRSRHRKLQYVRELEEKVEALMKQNLEMAERLRSVGLEP